jgi:proteasome accessory factor A
MFCISQRAEHIWEGVSSATTRSRPIINTRDEPHADAERYRRLHVIVGDSNMNEYASFLKVGAASALLRMLEEPSVVLRDMTLENPIRAIREISHDPTCTRTVRLANGREASALDIQSEFLNRALRFAETRGFPEEEQRALEMWEHC